MARLVTAELLKLRTTRTFLWLMAVLVALVLFALVVPLAVVKVEGASFALENEFTQRTLLSTAGTTGGTIVMVLGILGMTSEYRHATITPTFLVTPRRGRVMAAKIAAYALAGLLLGLLSMALTLAATLAGLAARNADLVLSSTDLTAIVAGGLLYFALAGVFGLALGAVVRNQVAALATVLVAFFLVENLLVELLPDIARWLPGQAASALYFPAGTTQGEGLMGAKVVSQSVGGLVFAAYTAVLAGCGVALTRRRDIH